MDKVFNPKLIEDKWYQIWEKGNYFAPQANKSGKSYCIMIPPPNVTGSLHMGHAFQDTIMDALIRFKRMQGFQTLWQVGTDHAGIATQMVVERQLIEQGTSRHDLGREEFIKKVWEWKDVSGNTITKQLRRLGASVDWSRERFTMDPQLSQAVQKSFIDLYREGLIYRGKRLVNWDPVLNTAISDIEVVAEEEDGFMWHINYPIVDSKEFITIATTRPETMLGDVAVAVNPEDERYKDLIGKKVEIPLCNREIPIIADDYVDPEFGTGCVKITPGHDFNDYEVGARHNLKPINIFNPDATINDNAPEAYRNLDRYAARQNIISDLKSASLLYKIENHKLKVPRGDRTQSVIEPYLTDQWFVKTESLAAKALEVVENKEIEFIPETWQKNYREWLVNIQDWCISRQLWWGHRIPAWYDDEGNVYVGYSVEEVKSHYKLADNINLRQDEDVLDTWFSSALWPFSTLGWPEETQDFKTFYPTDVLVTGFDIIFFWVARMVMFGTKFTQQIPFKKVYIHGLIQDQFGQKMSKSKGNVIDPLDLIDGIELEPLVAKRTSGLMQPQKAKQIEANTRKEFPDGIPAYGTDALRFTFCSLATHGRHLRFDLARLEGYRNFCNKLWNAARYVLLNTENVASDLETGPKAHSIADKWILSRWQKVKNDYITQFDNYRFDLAAATIYEFVWSEYCDWYLELSKPILNTEDASESMLRGTRHTLVMVLDEILRALHPIMPFITEEIWERLSPETQQDARALIEHTFPIVNQELIDEASEAAVTTIQQIIVAVRNIRGEMNISPGKQVEMCICNASPTAQKEIESHLLLLTSVGKISTITWLSNEEDAAISATALAGDLKILIPMKGLIDKQQEINRLNKEIQKLAKEMDKSQVKLANPNYVNKAPADVVAAEQEKMQSMKSALANLELSLDKVIKL